MPRINRRRLTSTVAPSEMTVSEFKKIGSDYQRKTAVSIFVPLVSAVALLAVYAAFRDPIEAHLSEYFGVVSGSVLAAFPMMLITLIMFTCILVLAQRVEREAGVPCPFCSKQLASLQHIVIASKSCPFCGEVVLSCERQGATKTVEPTGTSTAHD